MSKKTPQQRVHKKRSQGNSAAPTPIPTLLELEGVRLIGCNLKVEELSPVREVKCQVSARGIHESIDDSSSQVSFIVSVDVSLSEDKEAPEKIRMSCSFEVEYIAHFVMNEEIMSSLSRSATHLSWPYVRELFSSFVSRMGIPPVILPLVTIHPERGIVFITPRARKGK